MANPAKEFGSSRSLRLDPYQGTQCLEVGETSFKVDRNGVVVRKTLGCGLPISMAVPSRAFKGVAATAVENENGDTMVSLELLHHDPELCVPLLKANDLIDIAADWHSWSRLMKLPMLLADEDGEHTQVQKLLGDIMIEDPIERRKRITTVKRLSLIHI